jgi:hypothetical protein
VGLGRDEHPHLEMPRATEGQQLPLEQALNSLTDAAGNSIKFEKQEDGSYIAEGVDSNRYTYTVSLSPDPVKVRVSVLKEPKKAKSKSKPDVRDATPKEEKEVEQYERRRR